MKQKRVRLLSMILCGATALVLCAWAYVARDYVAETWYLHALERAATAEVKWDALEALAKVGRDRTAEQCIEALNEAEARSLVKTWRKDLFEAPGLRVVTVMPQWMYNALLPARILPLPDSFARVGLVLRGLKESENGAASSGLKDLKAR